MLVECRLDVGIEQWVALPWRRFELRVKLHANIPGVNRFGQLDDLSELLALGERRNDQAGLAQCIQVIDVGFVAVAVALGDHAAVNLESQRAFGYIRALRAQAHGAAQVGIFIARLDGAVRVFPFVDQGDHREGASGLEFGAVSVWHAGHMAGKLDGSDLHAQANTQVRHFVFAGKTRCTNLALNAALAKAAGHQNAVKLGQLRDIVRVDGFGVDVLDDDLGVVFHAGMSNGFVE